MPANSNAMIRFRENVRSILDATAGMNVTALTAKMNEAREIENKRLPKKERHLVSRTFVSNLLNGHFDCTLSFAQEISDALNVPLHTLILPSEKFSENLAQTA